MALLDKLQIVKETDTKIGEEFDDQLESEYLSDPEPGTPPPRAKSRAKARTPKKAPARTTSVSKLAREVSEDLATLLEGGAAVWGMHDQCCAPVLEQQARPIAQAFTAILSRNPRLLEKFASTDIVSYTLQSVALGKALGPVLSSVYHNHVSKAVEEGEEGQNGAVHLDRFPAFTGIDRSQPA